MGSEGHSEHRLGVESLFLNIKLTSSNNFKLLLLCI